MNKKTDQYGNNVDFKDEIMSDMTMKGLLGKWVELLYSKIEYAVFKYYKRQHNIDVNDMDTVKMMFEDAYNYMVLLTPILEDMVTEDYYGIEEIVEAIYGADSNEAYVLKDFKEKSENMERWKDSDMWDEFESNPRLKDIYITRIMDIRDKERIED